MSPQWHCDNLGGWSSSSPYSLHRPGGSLSQALPRFNACCLCELIFAFLPAVRILAMGPLLSLGLSLLHIPSPAKRLPDPFPWQPH